MYTLNDGIVYIYKRLPAKSEANKPVIKLDGRSRKKFYFTELGCGTKEYYDSQLLEIQIERRIQILRAPEVSSQDIAEIGAKRYNVGRVWHGLSKTGVPVTELTLEKLEAVYDG